MTVEPMSTADVEPSNQQHGRVRQSPGRSGKRLNNNDLEKSSVLKNKDSSSLPFSKKFTVYLNGICGVGQEVTIEFDQLFDWNDFVLELDSGINFSALTNNVFSENGEQLNNIEEVKRHDILVVGSGQPFIPLPYKTLPSSSAPPFTGVSGTGEDGHILSKSVQLRGSPLVSNRKFIRSNLAKSVYEIDASVESSSMPNNEISSLIKTMSEEQVCYRQYPATARPNGRLPNSIARHNVHPKPRPLSCYGTPLHSIYSNNESVSPLLKSSTTSKIPKRILPASTIDHRNTTNNVTTPSVQSLSSPVKVVASASTSNTKSSASKVENNSKSDKNNPNIKPVPVASKEKSVRQESKRDFIRPRIVSILRTGTKPRKVIRYLLNQKTARSFEQVLSDMTERLEAPWGAIRKVFTLSGSPVDTLEGFFQEEKIFLACPNDRHVPDDFLLDADEVKAIPNCLKLHPNAPVKAKGSDIQKTPSKRIKSLSSRVNHRTDPSSSSYPTHPRYLSVSELPHFILNKYIVGDIIGDGNFAVVRECIHRISGEHYALKVIDKTKSGLDAPPAYEIDILKSIRHPNIIHLFEDFEHNGEIFAILEFVPGGDLFDTIAACVKFSEEESAYLIRDIVSALSFLHSKGIVHRDIKPENLLVYYEGDHKRRIKVGDFGLAHFILEDPLYTVCGTPTYVAPEILAETGYGFKVDLWASGVILYILLCGYPPFSSTTGEQADLFDLILVGDYEFPSEQWDGISEDAKDLIMKMIESDVDMRFGANEVLDHPWLCTTAEEAEAKRHNLYKKDFRFNVFEQMGLTKLGLPHASSSTTGTTSLETSNSS